MRPCARSSATSATAGCPAAPDFLVSPSVVVTAGHCVFSRPRHLMLGPRRAAAHPRHSGARRNGPTPFGYQWAVRWYAHRRFVERGDVMYDFGLVVTPRPFRALPSVFPLSAPDDARLQDIRARRLLHIAGYPADKPAGRCGSTPSGWTAWGVARSITGVDTCPGHSGSPVWVQRDRAGHVDAIAIHVAGPMPHERGAWGCRPACLLRRRAPSIAAPHDARVDRDERAGRSRDTARSAHATASATVTICATPTTSALLASIRPVVVDFHCQREGWRTYRTSGAWRVGRAKEPDDRPKSRTRRRPSDVAAGAAFARGGAIGCSLFRFR